MTTPVIYSCLEVYWRAVFSCNSAGCFPTFIIFQMMQPLCSPVASLLHLLTRHTFLTRATCQTSCWSIGLYPLMLSEPKRTQSCKRRLWVFLSSPPALFKIRTTLTVSSGRIFFLMMCILCVSAEQQTAQLQQQPGCPPSHVCPLHWH